VLARLSDRLGWMQGRDVRREDIEIVEKLTVWDVQQAKEVDYLV